MFESLMPENSAVHIKYMPQSQLPVVLADLYQQKKTPLLLLDHFQSASSFPEQAFQPSEQSFIHLQSGLESIDEKQCELWIGDGQWAQSQKQLTDGAELSFCFNQDVLIGSLSISLLSGASLQGLSQSCYEQIIDFITAHNKPSLLRMWNYFPEINQSDILLVNSLERYQEFCIGRHNAFASSMHKDFEYPAASAVGGCSESVSSKLVIIFIAMNQPGKFLENPDQISAYQYPSQYSPKSPSFSRASIAQTEKFQQLYISGTASIVGHESRFQGDIINQTHQTIRNLQRLIDYSHANYVVDNTLSLIRSSVGTAVIKVYLRNPADKAEVAPIIQAFSCDSEYICYLQADICRQELDIEIEMLMRLKR